MRNLSTFFTILITFLTFFWIFIFFSLSNSKEPKILPQLLIISNETKDIEKKAEIEKAEKIVKQIKEAYNKTFYENVTELVNELPSDFSLTPEENFIVSESFLKSGLPEKAIEFSEKVISVKRGMQEACTASLIKIKSLIIKGDYRGTKNEIKNFLDSYCDEKLKKDAKILLYFIKELPEEEVKNLDKSLIKSIFGEIYKLRGLYFIKRGDLKKAEEDFFTYINVYGSYKEAPELIYKLAEAYFKKEEKEKAKIFYELIITEWDGTKEALFSKFRLYQIAYEKILIKELIPEKTKQDLISFATLIKSKYPEEKMAEEASFMIIKVYYEDKNYLLAKKNAIDFFKTFEKSSFIRNVQEYYCQSVSSILNESFEKQNVFSIIKTEKEDREIIENTKCSSAYYTLGDVYLNYNFYTKASYYFIKAHDLRNNNALIPKILLKLSFLALESESKDLFHDLFNLAIKKANEELKSDPYYFYLKAFYEMEKNLDNGEIYLDLALNSSLSQKLKKRLLRHFRDKALSLKRYYKALEYTKNPLFEAKVEDYITLLVESFNTDKSFFENALEYAKEKFPENEKIKWLEAYHLEKRGEIKESTKIWNTLSKGNSLENELAKSYEKMKNFIERSHQTIF